MHIQVYQLPFLWRPDITTKNHILQNVPDNMTSYLQRHHAPPRRTCCPELRTALYFEKKAACAFRIDALDNITVVFCLMVLLILSAFPRTCLYGEFSRSFTRRKATTSPRIYVQLPKGLVPTVCVCSIYELSKAYLYDVDNPQLINHNIIAKQYPANVWVVQLSLLIAYHNLQQEYSYTSRLFLLVIPSLPSPFLNSCLCEENRHYQHLYRQPRQLCNLRIKPFGMPR